MILPADLNLESMMSKYKLASIPAVFSAETVFYWNTHMLKQPL